MEDFDPKDEDFRLWAMIVWTRRAIYRAMAKELQKCGLTVEETAAMFMIRAIEAVGSNPIPTEVSRWLFREPHSTSTLLVRMERKGLVKRDKDLRRKNLVRVSLTRKGREIFAKAAEFGSLHRMFSGLSHKERQQLEASLRIVRRKAMGEIALEQSVLYPFLPFEEARKTYSKRS